MKDVATQAEDPFTSLEISVGEKRNRPFSSVLEGETVATIAINRESCMLKEIFFKNSNCCGGQTFWGEGSNLGQFLEY